MKVSYLHGFFVLEFNLLFVFEFFLVNSHALTGTTKHEKRAQLEE